MEQVPDTNNNLGRWIEFLASKVHDLGQGDIVFDLRATAQADDLLSPKQSQLTEGGGRNHEVSRALMKAKRELRAAE